MKITVFTKKNFNCFSKRNSRAFRPSRGNFLGESRVLNSVSYPQSRGCSCTRIRQLCRCRFRCSDSGYLDSRPRSPRTSLPRTRADTRSWKMIHDKKISKLEIRIKFFCVILILFKFVHFLGPQKRDSISRHLFIRIQLMLNPKGDITF